MPGIDLGGDRLPDENTIFNFRHLLERHGLTATIFADVNAHLTDKGFTLRSGNLVDATIIDAPCLTKKGNDWTFGPLLVVCGQTTGEQRKALSVDVGSVVTNVSDTSTAKVNNSQFWDAKGYVSAGHEAMFTGPGKSGRHAQGAERQRPAFSEAWVNRIIAMVPAKVDYPFRLIKCQFGHVETRAEPFMLFALSNLFLMRRRLMA